MITHSHQTYKNYLRTNKFTWLITGAAGFIGSHLVEELLSLDQSVVGVDNFLTGKKENLEIVAKNQKNSFVKNFTLYEIDITNEAALEKLPSPDFILHQAALGSVPRSLESPIESNKNNVTGFLHVLYFSKQRQVKNFVYASSSSVYGDHQDLPKLEALTGNLQSPYAVTKMINEMYASVFSRSYDMCTVGLRYFNVFGPRQDPNGQYAAVIPRWIDSTLNDETLIINGDGSTSRDFCYVKNVVQANILAALSFENQITSPVYNISCGGQTTLNELASSIQESIKTLFPALEPKKLHTDFRKGDIKHSIADISKAKKFLGYLPEYEFDAGMKETINYSCQNL